MGVLRMWSPDLCLCDRAYLGEDLINNVFGWVKIGVITSVTPNSLRTATSGRLLAVWPGMEAPSLPRARPSRCER